MHIDPTSVDAIVRLWFPVLRSGQAGYVRCTLEQRCKEAERNLEEQLKVSSLELYCLAAGVSCLPATHALGATTQACTTPPSRPSSLLGAVSSESGTEGTSVSDSNSVSPGSSEDALFCDADWEAHVQDSILRFLRS